ncbi:MAG: hypothetical protein OTJ44_08055, partial [Planctomycetota bacterium]|nr:hypothetical protein [Planctomycetota bacterium]
RAIISPKLAQAFAERIWRGLKRGAVVGGVGEFAAAEVSTTLKSCGNDSVGLSLFSMGITMLD